MYVSILTASFLSCSQEYAQAGYDATKDAASQAADKAGQASQWTAEQAQVRHPACLSHSTHTPAGLGAFLQAMKIAAAIALYPNIQIAEVRVAAGFSEPCCKLHTFYNGECYSWTAGCC